MYFVFSIKMNVDDCINIMYISTTTSTTKLLYIDLFNIIIIYNLLCYRNFDPREEENKFQNVYTTTTTKKLFFIGTYFFGRHFGCYFSFPFKTHLRISTYYLSCFIIYYYVKCLSYLQRNLLRYLRADRKRFGKVFQDARALVHPAKRY